MDNQAIGLFIRQLRTEKNLTQKELADRLHVTDKAVSKWERGLSLPAIDLLSPLSRALDISVVELMDAQRHQENSIDLEKANAILEDTTQRLKRTIRFKRLALLLIFILLFITTRISGRLLWNQGLLLDERNVSIQDIYYVPLDNTLTWIGFALQFLLLWITFFAALRKEEPT